MRKKVEKMSVFIYIQPIYLVLYLLNLVYLILCCFRLNVANNFHIMVVKNHHKTILMSLPTTVGTSGSGLCPLKLSDLGYELWLALRYGINFFRRGIPTSCALTVIDEVFCHFRWETTSYQYHGQQKKKYLRA